MTSRHLRSIVPFLLAGTLGCSSPVPADEPADADRAEQGVAALAPVPPAVLATWTQLVGTWIADNAAFRSDDEPFDAYGLDWRWGIGQQSLVGRLYGLRDGEDVGSFWEFREYWHPQDGQLIAMQFGAGGAVGIGPHDIRPDGTSEMVQTFFYPGPGTIERVGHRSRLSGDEHVTASFTVSDDGTWTERRSYTWRRRPGR